jgi:hypothetical protein
MRQNSGMVAVAQLDLNRSSYAQFSQNPDYIHYNYTAPQYLLDKVSRATAAGGEILPTPAPAVNSTYDYDFYGPSLSLSECLQTGIVGLLLGSAFAISRNVLLYRLGSIFIQYHV